MSQPEVSAGQPPADDTAASPTEQLSIPQAHLSPRTVITGELAAAFWGSALATAAVEQNRPGYVLAGALAVTATILSQSYRAGFQVDNARMPDQP